MAETNLTGTNLAAGGPSRGERIVIRGLQGVLGVLFLAVGFAKLTGTGNTVAYFAAIGWGQWFRYLTGLLDVAGIVLLFMPRRTFYGALVLACSVGTATLISMTVLRRNATWGGTQMIAVPLVLTLLCLALAWLTRPVARG